MRSQESDEEADVGVRRRGRRARPMARAVSNEDESEEEMVVAKGRPRQPAASQDSNKSATSKSRILAGKKRTT